MTDSIAAILGAPFELPNGQVVPNRLMKSAMSEALGTADGTVGEALPTLYGRWARGGVGLSVTGNVMVDRNALGEPGNVALEDDRDPEGLSRWAAAAKSGGGLVWMQLNHPGRQVPRFLNAESVAPSAVAFEGDLRTAFATPRALTASEIQDVIARFGTAAGLAQAAGFDGVEIHGAHGYLVSQFLSPHTNRRTDAWGGSAANRRRFLLEILEAIRGATRPGFGLGVKINSADFQRGGITEDEATDSVAALGEAGVDLVEVSGGTYEAPAMVGAKQSTREREAYFLAFAEAVRERVAVPLAVTGGFRSGRAMADAIRSGAVDLVGMARALAVRPDFPRELVTTGDVRVEVRPLKIGLDRIDRMGMTEMVWYGRQLQRMGRGDEPEPDEGPIKALLAYGWSQGLNALRPRRG